jgi:hypothetical protein
MRRESSESSSLRFLNIDRVASNFDLKATIFEWSEATERGQGLGCLMPQPANLANAIILFPFPRSVLHRATSWQLRDNRRDPAGSGGRAWRECN